MSLIGKLSLTLSLFGVLLTQADCKPGRIPRLFVAGQSSIRVYDLTSRGEQKPLRILQGPHTGLDQPAQMGFFGDELFVAQKQAVLVFDLHGQGDLKPRRVIQGGKTLLEDGHGLVVNNQEIFVSSTLSDWILVFGRGDHGNVPPIRTLWGPETQLHWPRALAIVGNELAVANRLQSQIAFFKLKDIGNTRPTHTLDGIHSPNEVAAVGTELLVGDGYGSIIWSFSQKTSGPPARRTHPDFLGPSGIAASAHELFLGAYITHRVLVYSRESGASDQPLRQLLCPDGPNSLLIAPSR